MNTKHSPHSVRGNKNMFQCHFGNPEMTKRFQYENFAEPIYFNMNLKTQTNRNQVNFNLDKNNFTSKIFEIVQYRRH